MSNDSVRRARWRADLLDYGAAGHASFGDNTSAARKAAEASLNRDFADLAEKHQDAQDKVREIFNKQFKAVKKAGLTDNQAYGVPLNMEDMDVAAAVDAMHLAAKDLADSRRFWREIGAFNGRGMSATVDNFAEPSEDELIEMGY